MFDLAENPSPVIKVIGVGGGGCNAVKSMIGTALEGVGFILANTDFSSTEATESCLRLQLGERLTRGLGAGSDPEIGRKAAEEAEADLLQALQGADLIFVAAGMGGGTGTGAASVIAEIARSTGALTVGVVTKPFLYEGKRRMEQAERGIDRLKESVDSLMVIPNERLRSTGRGLSILNAFRPADEVLQHAIRGIFELIHCEGHINIDFADLRTIMCHRGMAIMGVGVAEGPHRAQTAAQRAITSPLLEGFDISRAKGVLINIAGSSEMSLEEFHSASEVIQEKIETDAEIITGLVFREELGATLQVTAIATGSDRVNPARTVAPEGGRAWL